MFTTQEDTPVEKIEHMEEQENFPTQEDTLVRYVLPPRANRRVLPKRYSPEKESRRSRYPMANIVKGNLEAKAFALSMYSDEIPNNTEQALKSKHWKDAMQEEMKALTKNNSWEKRVLPPRKKFASCRWVFTIKYKPGGTTERYKVRLVAKGYTQTYGIDYCETFSLVAEINTIRVLIFVATNKGWPLHQFDVKNAFLHGELKEEFYMEAPHGFTDSFGEREEIFMYQKKYVLDLLAEISMVDCKPADTLMIVNQKLYMKKKAHLADKGIYQRMFWRKRSVHSKKKSFYGLKQSPRAWFGKFTLVMKHYGFKQRNDKEEITKLKKNLFTKFEIKDLGRLKYFLGIEVLRSKQEIFMYQKKYVLDLLAEISMVDCKPADTLMIVNQKLYMKKKAHLADKGIYQRMAHMNVVLRIIRYLQGTARNGVLFEQNGHLETQLYIDANWAGDIDDRRSTSSYFTLVGRDLITLRSKKQKTVALLSAEAEFRGIARGLTKVLWVRRLLTEIGYPPQEASKIMSDNKAAIQILENPVQHDRIKHIKEDQHFIKEKSEAEIITLLFVRSQDQLADILTKAVNERTLHECLGKLNFENPTIQLEGEC
nr:putative RNA-directed DNA polymerase [Tanacetum cinerariifolium]